MLLRPGVALLLGAALAGCSDDGLTGPSTTSQTSTTSGTSSAQTGSNDTGDPASSTGTGSGDSTGSTTGGSSTGTTGESSSSSSTTGPGSTTTGSGSESSTTEAAPNQACADGCAVEFMCGNEWATEQDCVDWCEANLIEADKFSPFCRDAWEGVSACVGTLTCGEFAEWENPAAFPYPCSDADAILNVECRGQAGLTPGLRR